MLSNVLCIDLLLCVFRKMDINTVLKVFGVVAPVVLVARWFKVSVFVRSC